MAFSACSDDEAVLIRAARPDDAKALSQLASVTFFEAYDPMARHEDLRAYVDEHYTIAKFANELEDARIATWLALRGDDAGGFLQLHEAPAPAPVRGKNPLKLARLYLRKANWRGGLGQRFVQLARRTAMERGHDSLWLSVWEKNPRAVRFYERSGFVDIGWEIFVTGEDRSIDRLMESML